MSHEGEIVLMLSLFGASALAGAFARRLPLSGWTALAFAAVVPSAGFGLMLKFC